MLTPEERLTAANPFGAATYAHADFDAVLGRVVTDRRAPRARRETRRLLGVAAGMAIAVACVLAFVLNGLGTPTSSAAVLHLERRFDGTSLASPTPPQPAEVYRLGGHVGGRPVVYETPPTRLVFRAGPALSRSRATAPAYRVVTPRDGAALVRRLARVFGVHGRLRGHGGTAPDWVIGVAPGPRVWYQVQGSIPQFGYVADLCAQGSAMRGCSPHPNRRHGGELAQRSMTLTTRLGATLAARYVQRLGLGYRIGRPLWGPLGTSPDYDQCGHLCRFRQATFPVMVDGQPTEEAISFTFTQRGAVIAAYGAPSGFEALRSYPLLSPAAGVSALNATRPTTGGVGALESTGPPVCHPVRCTVVRTHGHVPIHVTLNAVSTLYEVYVLGDGSLVLLPVYTYTARSGAHDALSWQQLAVVPSDVAYPTHARG